MDVQKTFCSCSTIILNESFLSVHQTRVLWNVDFWPSKQTDWSSVKEGHRRPEHQDTWVDWRSDWTLRGRPGVNLWCPNFCCTLVWLSWLCFNNAFLFFCQMFVSFGENGLVTCSADHLLILWKNGERQSRLRSLALFQKLEENGGLWPLTLGSLP